MDETENSAIDNQRIIDLTPDLICVVDMNGTFRYVNGRWETVLGHARDEITGRTVRDFIHPDDRSRSDEILSDLANTSHAVDFENRYIHKDGTIRHICWCARAVPEEEKIYCIGKEVPDRRKVEDRVETETTHWGKHLDSSRDGIAIINQAHRVVDANLRFAEMLGYTSEEVLDLHTWDFEAVMTEAEIREGFSDITKTDTVFETRHRRKDGQIIEVEVSARGACVGGETMVFTVCRDIGERKRAEEKIRDSERRLRALSDATFESIFFSDRGVCVDQNLSAEKTFGYTLQDAVGRNGTEWIVPDDRDQVKNNMMAGHEKPYEVTALRKDGTTFAAEIQGRMFVYQGRPVRVTALRDITDRKLAEEGLRESEAKFRTLFDASPMAMALIEMENGNVIDVNGKFCDWMKCDKQALIGKKAAALSFQSEEDLANLLQEMQDAGSLNGLSIDLLSQDGDVLNSQIFARIMGVSGKPHVLTMFVDTTEKKRLEAALLQAHKMEAIGTLAGGIAHEFNNILGIIIGNVELAADDIPKWTLAGECIEEIRIASLRAKDVVRKILSVARKAQSSRKPIRIGPVVDESLRLLRATLPATITMIRNIHCEAEIVLADPTEINQVLMNLCSNSAHAMRGDSGVLEVNLEPIELDREGASRYDNLVAGEFVRLTVKDTGIGISSQIMDRIFDPYFTTKEVDEGLGMGLSIVYGIVKKHDGAIDLESETGKGTKVEILLPRIQGALEDELLAPEGLPTGSERILVVDDEPSIVKMVKRILGQLGYSVEGMTSSVEALKLFRMGPEQFDLVITDMAMPELSGDRLSHEILKVRPDIPIILCTGHSDQIDEVRAGELGIMAYRSKPLEKRELAETVREILDQCQRR